MQICNVIYKENASKDKYLKCRTIKKSIDKYKNIENTSTYYWACCVIANDEIIEPVKWYIT